MYWGACGGSSALRLISATAVETSTTLSGNILKYRLVFDFVANKMTLYYKGLDAAPYVWTKHAVLRDVAAGLDWTVNSARNPSKWNGIHLRSESDSAYFSNFRVGAYNPWYTINATNEIVPCPLCSAGTYAVGVCSIGSNMACQPCSAGTYGVGVGLSQCVACGAGTYSAAGASVCLTCPGKASSVANASACTANVGYWSGPVPVAKMISATLSVTGTTYTASASSAYSGQEAYHVFCPQTSDANIWSSTGGGYSSTDGS